ncbi:MAG TPA: plastocyanin/azurin family copper-binding protein, partial [Acidobacteriota bacterium]|nr:plastocyanin/azurin family copper-binding protein [Acidobacteriota bacterium]
VSFLDLEEKKVEGTISVEAAPRKIAIQPGNIPETNAENKMAGIESEKKMPAKHITITMQGPPPKFQPQTVEIESGTTVDWINSGTRVHTVTGENSDWDSGSMGPGEKFSKVFNEKGTFKYYCVPHREIGMVGTIIVK